MEQYELITGGGCDDETAVESSRGSDIHMLQSCQQEVDTRIILYAAHREGYERLIISCGDTDVFVLLIYFSGQLCQVWVRAGTRQQRQNYEIHDISSPPCIKISWHIMHLQGAML